MSRRKLDIPALLLAVALLFAGCEAVDSALPVLLPAGVVAAAILNDPPDKVVPANGNNQNASAGRGGGPTFGNDNNANGGIGNSNNPGSNNNNNSSPATYRTRLGVVLLIACQPDVNCDPSVFGCQADAQAYFDAVRAAGLGDCHGLDSDRDLIACEALRVTCP